jgi:hypothetical protein
MPDQERIRSIAREVATATLGRANVDHVISKEIVDTEGNDALQIMVVLTPGSSDTLSGAALLATMVKLHERLRQEGEARFPFVRYADKKELEESGAAQPRAFVPAGTQIGGSCRLSPPAVARPTGTPPTAARP